MAMKDDEIIARQARKIVQLERDVANGLESERQLLDILRSAGIEVKQVEINAQEAEFLRLYREATPEGKANIRAKAEEVVARTVLSEQARAAAKAALEKKLRRTNALPDGEELSGLPRNFFKRTNSEK